MIRTSVSRRRVLRLTHRITGWHASKSPLVRYVFMSALYTFSMEAFIVIDIVLEESFPINLDQESYAHLLQLVVVKKYGCEFTDNFI